MRILNHICWILAAALLLSCIKATNGKQPPSIEFSETIRKTEKLIHRTMKKQHIPGFAVVIVHNKDVVYRNVFGFSDMETSTLASNKTVWKTWSVAKAFTATEIFREVEEGLIDLDAPLLTYLPDFSIHTNYRDQRPISIRDVLAHRAGLPRNECVPVPSNLADPRGLERFEIALTDCYTAFPVATRYKYSNVGYDMLGRVIEENRQQSYIGYMDHHVLGNLGMMNSTFDATTISDPGLIAKGYEYYKGKYYPRDQSKNIGSVPSGNLYTTIGDLSTFLKTAFSNELFQKGSTLSTMVTDYYSSETDPETMGLGWKTTKLANSELMAWHDGGPTEGVGALIAFLPNRNMGLALIGNSTSFGGNISAPLAKEILGLMLEEKLGNPRPKSPKIRQAKVSSKVLESYEGKYVAWGQIMDVSAKSNKLKGKIAGIGLDLVPVSDTAFKITHWTDKIGLTKIFKPPVDFDKIQITFIPSEDNTSTMIINLDNISFEICTRYPEPPRGLTNWQKLVGKYRLAWRQKDNAIGDLTDSYFNINLEEDVLVMSNPFGPIVPVDNHIIIVSGSFAGEIIEYDGSARTLIHQNAIFIPVDEEQIGEP